jgi:hypothetical protein
VDDRLRAPALQANLRVGRSTGKKGRGSLAERLHALSFLQAEPRGW